MGQLPLHHFLPSLVKVVHGVLEVMGVVVAMVIVNQVT